MDKFQNKYRIPSTRAQWWDYGNNAAYFVTVCTQNRIHYFGEIVVVETQNFASLRATEIGKFAETCWYDIPNHFPFVQLGAFVVMPNHIHGIIIIDKPKNTTQLSSKNKFGPQSQNLASIVRGYKIGVTKQSKIICPKFQWQPRYHDHIIRNNDEYQRIKDYINRNPEKWEQNKFQTL